MAGTGQPGRVDSIVEDEDLSRYLLSQSVEKQLPPSVQYIEAKIIAHRIDITLR